jgi:hypothetical protein
MIFPNFENVFLFEKNNLLGLSMRKLTLGFQVYFLKTVAKIANICKWTTTGVFQSGKISPDFDREGVAPTYKPEKNKKFTPNSLKV